MLDDVVGSSGNEGRGVVGKTFKEGCGSATHVAARKRGGRKKKKKKQELR